MRCLIIALCFATAWAASGHADPRFSPLVEKVNAHELVPMQIHHAQLMKAPMQGGEDLLYPQSTVVTFNAYGKSFELNLYKNNDLFSKSYHEIRDRAGVQEFIHRHDLVNCFYHGHVSSFSDSPGFENMVAVSLCNGVNGYVRAFGDEFHITSPGVAPSHLKRAQHLMSTVHAEQQAHMVYRTSDLKSKPKLTCGNDPEFTHEGLHAPFVARTMATVDGQASQVHDHKQHDPHHDHSHDHKYTDPMFGSRRGAGSVRFTPSAAPRYAEILAFNDLSYFQAYGMTTEFRTALLYNIAAGYYSISSNLDPPVVVLLKAQITFTDSTHQNIIPPVQTPKFSTAFLTNVSNFIQTYPNAPAHDAAAMFTFVSLLGSASSGPIGVAWTGGICRAQYKYSLNNADHTGFDAFDATLVAHELGHNLGMCHDPVAPFDAQNPVRTGSTCVNLAASYFQSPFPCSGHIMSPSASIQAPEGSFSTCSNSDWNNYHTSGFETCMGEPVDKSIYNATALNSTCGNGILEGLEECDCGGTADCAAAPSPLTDACCDGSTCKLKVTSACSDKVSACCSSCQFASSSTTCRAVGAQVPNKFCDVAETCTGNSADCPADVFNGNGVFCQPAAPVISSVAVANQTLTVFFAGPSNDGGKSVQNYTLTLQPGNIVIERTAASLLATNNLFNITVEGLTNGVQYTITLQAANSQGSGSTSTTTATPTDNPSNDDDDKSSVEKAREFVEDNWMYFAIGVGAIVLYCCIKSCCCKDEKREKVRSRDDMQMTTRRR